MLTTRRALLIANPGEIGEELYCKGVFKDVENYYRLLRSPEGGAWAPREITYLKRPNRTTVRLWLARVSSISYVFILFTGHGYYSRIRKDRILSLRAGQSLASRELSTGAKKRTIILDCCQEKHMEPLIKKLARLISLSEAKELQRPDRAMCRQLFLQRVRRASAGVVKLMSCSIGQTSSDSDERGGRYSSSLLDCIEDWSRTHSNGNGLFSQRDSSLSVMTAHACATRRTRRASSGLQIPTFVASIPCPDFPVAVFR